MIATFGRAGIDETRFVEDNADIHSSGTSVVGNSTLPSELR